MNRRRLLRRLLDGQFANVRFSDAVSLLEGFGFREVRMRGDHHIFSHPEVDELLNLQEVSAVRPSPINCANFWG